MEIIKNNKGFTLIELLLMMIVIGIMAITAIGSYISTAENFTFLSDFNALTETFKRARLLAIHSVDMDTIDRYGIELKKTGSSPNFTYSVLIFGDVSTGTPYEYETGVDTIIFDSEHTFDSDFEFSMSKPTGTTTNYYFYYENGTGDFTAYYSPSGTPILLPKVDVVNRYLQINFNTIDNSITRYILISQISGLAESFREAKI